MIKSLKAMAGAIAMLLALAASSCSNLSGDSSLTIMDPASYNIPYDDNLVWIEATAESVPLTLAPFTFSHWTNGTDWTGFVPSRASETAITSDWTERQWTSITGAGIGAPGMPYFVVGWNKDEPLDAIPSNPSALVRQTYSGETFTPHLIWITNTAQAFHTMRTGMPGVASFTRSDWAKVLINGVKDGKLTGTLTVWLARDGQILGDPDAIINNLSNGGGWYAVDAESLGEVDYIYFQMQSSRADMVPTFVVGAFSYTE